MFEVQPPPTRTLVAGQVAVPLDVVKTASETGALDAAYAELDRRYAVWLPLAPRGCRSASSQPRRRNYEGKFDGGMALAYRGWPNRAVELRLDIGCSSRALLDRRLVTKAFGGRRASPANLETKPQSSQCDGDDTLRAPLMHSQPSTLAARPAWRVLPQETT